MVDIEEKKQCEKCHAFFPVMQIFKHWVKGNSSMNVCGADWMNLNSSERLTYKKERSGLFELRHNRHLPY